MVTMLNPNAIQNGSITQEMIDASVLDGKQNIADESLATTSKEVVGAINELFNNGKRDATAIMDLQDEIVNKQDDTDNTLQTTSKKVVGAINEVYNGGVKDKSIEIGKLAQAVQDTLETVVTNQDDIAELQGLINTKVKIINEDTDLNTLTEDGLYLLSAVHSYINYPLSDGASGGSVFLNGAALLIVSHRFTETQISQVVLSVSNVYRLPLARNRNYDGSSWSPWNDDDMHKVYKDVVVNSVKYTDLSELTDTEVNNIWDNN